MYIYFTSSHVIALFMKDLIMLEERPNYFVNIGQDIWEELDIDEDPPEDAYLNIFKMSKLGEIIDSLHSSRETHYKFINIPVIQSYIKELPRISDESEFDALSQELEPDSQ